MAAEKAPELDWEGLNKALSPLFEENKSSAKQTMLLRLPWWCPSFLGGVYARHRMRKIARTIKKGGKKLDQHIFKIIGRKKETP